MAIKKLTKEKSLAEVFGMTVRSYREKLGLMQDKLAYHVDVTPGYLSQIETGKTNITLPILWNLARALNAKPSALIRDAEKQFGLEKGRP